MASTSRKSSLSRYFEDVVKIRAYEVRGHDTTVPPHCFSLTGHTLGIPRDLDLEGNPRGVMSCLTYINKQTLHEDGSYWVLAAIIVQCQT